MAENPEPGATMWAIGAGGAMLTGLATWVSAKTFGNSMRIERIETILGVVADNLKSMADRERADADQQSRMEERQIAVLTDIAETKVRIAAIERKISEGGR